MLPPTILSITGSDPTGGAGVQADVCTVSAMGGRAVTAITAVAVQSSRGIDSITALAPDVVAGQIRAVIADGPRPAAVKVGLIHGAAAVRAVRDEIIGLRHIVCDPGILSSHGTPLADEESIAAFSRHLLPEAELLILRTAEAERLLGIAVRTDDDMLTVARALTARGPSWVMLRGARHSGGRVTALLYGPGKSQFFTSYNIEGWQRHGVGGALSTAIATRLAFGDSVEAAVRHAHDYIHAQVVYAVEVSEATRPRPVEIYNRLLDLVAAHFTEAHDVAYYADRLAITTRYLAQVTREAVGKSPKQIIDAYLLHAIEQRLATTSCTLQEVADALGFTSSRQLTKFFHAKRGCSPSQWRACAKV